MANSPHFSKAPIVEALINIEVAPLPDSIINDFRNIAQGISDSYPQKQDLSQLKSKVQFLPEGPQSSSSQSVIGFQAQSSDLKNVFQARLNGFSFHRLSPYSDWEVFRSEAYKLWSLYRNAAGPVQFQTFALRYINRLQIPSGERIERYLRVYPEIPSELPQTMSNYFVRLELPIEGSGLLVIHQTLLPSDIANTAIVLLDLELRYSGLGLTDQAVWDRIESARVEKNRYFLACITDNMKARLD
jgi:uncharacterized protein (TIGR04255 family)